MWNVFGYIGAAAVAIISFTMLVKVGALNPAALMPDFRGLAGSSASETVTSETCSALGKTGFVVVKPGGAKFCRTKND